MEWGWIILIVVVVAIVLFLIVAYNGLVRLRNMVDEAWNQISVQLKRRHDLIPNLVNAVKGYMDFEQETLTRVIEARGAAVSAAQAGPAGAAQQAQAENFLTGALRQLFALVENYPDLKANQNVLQLQEELTTTENQIGFSRQHYNSTVREFNTSIQTFPNVLIAGMFGFRERDYFQIEEADAAVPEVNLRTTEPPPAAPPAAPPPASPPPAAPPSA
ncbi:MAG TPA: LemA family protein [Candidatus Limnocylindria bacterium]|nr:LemA family protein [Candidatus Limnocylindria bacterium]